eukprot:jgi/Galph1/2111/GphlegSOOS_G808.1
MASGRVRSRLEKLLPDKLTWVLYGTKLSFYVITFIFSVVVDALVSNAKFNIFDKSPPNIHGDFCAYKASLASPAGVTAICKYLIAVGALGLVFSMAFVGFSLWTLFAHRISELWLIEALLNAFWMVWWFIAAGVATAARPSTGILDAANNRSAINGVEAVSWVNATLFLFNVFLSFAVFWSFETGFWIPTIDDYLHATNTSTGENDNLKENLNVSQVTTDSKQEAKLV